MPHAEESFPVRNVPASIPVSGHFGLALSLIALALIVSGCSDQGAKPAPADAEAGRAQLEETIKAYHNAAADAHGAKKEALLKKAAARYERLTEDFANKAEIAAPARLGLASVFASLGRTNDAIRHYAAVADRHPARDWDVLQAWKSAADLLWDGNRQEEARKYYAKIVERFDRPESTMVVQAVVRGAKSRL
jgi:tetratricopeptide (TPR) repeat protein